MKTIILAGGRGLRMGELSRHIPKPLVEIGGFPTLLHIMRHYEAHGFCEFVVALGYLGELVQESMRPIVDAVPNMHVDFVPTGRDTQTGGRLKRLADRVGDETFMLTWGDGLSDVNLHELLDFHRMHGRLATVTAVQPPSRFGHLDLCGDQVRRFEEKPRDSGTWINGAFFVLEPEVLDYIEGDETSWEREPMERLAADGQLMAYRHRGFWQCMDTMAERDQLEELWQSGRASWVVRHREPRPSWTSGGTKRSSSALRQATDESKPTRSVSKAASSLTPRVGVSARPKRVLVTGHDGYIGRILVPLLQDSGVEVIGTDTQFYRDCHVTDVWQNVSNLGKDIRDLSQSDLTEFDAVINLAGLSNDPLGDLDPELTWAINYQAVVQLARRAKETGVSRFLQASTCSVYGAADDDWLTEASPINPVTPYARAKAEAEVALAKLADDSFSPTFLRCATAYGVSPKLRGDLVVNNLVGYAKATGEVFLKSDGMAWRPIVHIEDISRAILAAAVAPRGRVHCEAFNVGSTSENYRIREIADRVGKLLPEARIVFSDGAGADVRNYRVNCDKLTRVFPKAKANWNLDRGIQELAAFYSQMGLRKSDLEGPRLQRLTHIQELMNDGRLTSELRWNETRIANEPIARISADIVRPINAA